MQKETTEASKGARVRLKLRTAKKKEVSMKKAEIKPSDAKLGREGDPSAGNSQSEQSYFIYWMNLLFKKILTYFLALKKVLNEHMQ